MGNLRALVASLAALFLGCSAQQAGNAALAAAFHVAETAVYVAAEDGCWGDCAHGTRCNPSTNLCEPYKESDGPVSGSAVQPAPLSVCALSMQPGSACSAGEADCLLDATCATVCTCETNEDGDASWACAGPPCEEPLRPLR
jgi:hypothetical protein